MSSIEFLGLGELLWDVFPDGKMPGGAPANVAFHAQQLGLSAATVTRVGMDLLGDEICEYLESQGLRLDLVQRDLVHGTGTVSVEPEAAGTRYTFKPDSAWDFIEPLPALLDAMRSARAVCFGTLAQRSAVSRSAIHTCLDAASDDCLIVYDVNLRPPFYKRDWIEKSLGHARLVKLNDDEVRILGEMLNSPQRDDLGFAEWLLNRHELDMVCVTRGARGCLLVSAAGNVDLPGIPVKVVDTVGAGDAFTAALIWSRLAGWPLSCCAMFANNVGSLVASRRGAMPVLRDEFAALRQKWSAEATAAT